MRTVRRQTQELNKGKIAALGLLLAAYAVEKRHWLDFFARKANRHLILNHRLVRDEAIKVGYAPKSGLQARMWKLALIDAAQTWDRYWQAMFVEVRSKLGRRKDFNDVDRHYAFWLLAGYGQFFACLGGTAPEPKFAIDPARRTKIGFYIQRQILKLRGRNPMVRIARSAVFDAGCYNVFEEGSVQYVKLTGLEKGNRIALPLLGKTGIEGNIRLVRQDDGSFEIHTGFELAAKDVPEGNTVGVDMGYTEVFTDAKGDTYGKGLGEILTQGSDDRHVKGKARNKLRAVAEKAIRHGDAAKARRIRKYNLGNIKWARREHKVKASIGRVVNTAIRDIVRERKVSILILEDLRHAFTYNKPPSVNRRLSSWCRGIMQDRAIFLAEAEGFRVEQVNAAYGSQRCLLCDFVDAGNRIGDRFVCGNCKYEDRADRVAAVNYEIRLADREITRYTPFREVKAILLSRFYRRLEAEGLVKARALTGPRATVPGKTPDTMPLARPRPGRTCTKVR